MITRTWVEELGIRRTSTGVGPTCSLMLFVANLPGAPRRISVSLTLRFQGSRCLTTTLAFILITMAGKRPLLVSEARGQG